MKAPRWWSKFVQSWPWRRIPDQKLTPPPEVPSTRKDIDETRARLDRASRRLLRMIDIEIEAQRRAS